jgi:cysteinyl-tRNA synthetase
MGSNQPLNLYDTRTREVSLFKPIVDGEVSIYLCGPTVQASPHIGHVRSAVNFDILRRWLVNQGYKVSLVRNVTDIDDKILQKSVVEKMKWFELAYKYEREFTQSYQILNVLPPTYEPRATGHITQMVELMDRLIERGKAYAPGNGDVYLSVRSLDSYLTLSRQNMDDLQAAEDALATYKKDPRDFALWKAAKPGEPSWPTPWGAGRPGWHLECSAMAYAYLGENFDIHGGGLDLIFPHHENEIAQSEAAGYKFANRWMHNAWVTQSGEKMSKSLGNTLLVSELVKLVRPIELRWYLGSAHYRSMLEFSEQALVESAVAFKRIENFLRTVNKEIGSIPAIEVSLEFASALNNDLAIPQAIATIYEDLRLGNIALQNGNKELALQHAALILAALNVLGVNPFETISKADHDEDLLNGLVELALIERKAARERKDFATSDLIRDHLASLGITIEDTATGIRWSKN